MPLKRRLIVGFTLFLVVYGGFYSGTTRVQPQGMGGLSGPVRVRVFSNENHLIAFYPLYLIERWCRNGSFVYASYHFNVDFDDKHYDRSWLYGDGKYSRIWYDLRGVVWFPKRDDNPHVTPPVELAPNLPESARHAILHLDVRIPGHGRIGGSRSMDSPIGSGSSSDGHFEEERLIGIKSDGFEVLLTQGQDKTVQSAMVFFPFRETTKVNVLGCEVTGSFK